MEQNFFETNVLFQAKILARWYTEAATESVQWKKVFLKISQNSYGKHLCRSLVFNKLAGLRPATLLKKKFQNCESFKNTFFIEHIGEKGLVG